MYKQTVLLRDMVRVTKYYPVKPGPHCATKCVYHSAHDSKRI